MSQIGTALVGNEFTLPKRSLHVAQPQAKLHLVGDNVPVIPVEAISTPEIIPVTVTNLTTINHVSQFFDLLHRHSLIVFALLFLLVGASGIEVGGKYLEARISYPTASNTIKKSAIAGLNLSVPADQLSAKLQSITGQPASLTVGNQTVSISPETIKSWLRITSNANKSEDYIHISSPAMSESLNNMASKFVATPVNQVSVTHDGSSQVVIAGQDGATLTDPASLVSQVKISAKSVMNGNGINFSTPLADQPFQAVTPTAFNKLIEVNVNTHQMYLYDNGNLTQSYAVSAGAPDTPTPIGEFHIWEKLTEQTMKGINPNGTPYIQPNVQWINYFDHRGDAVHGNYWRPLSVFGYVNTSHGCVSLPNDQAEWVYNWAPIGTTVITHY